MSKQYKGLQDETIDTEMMSEQRHSSNKAPAEPDSEGIEMSTIN